jgi:hypothetical protein
MNLRKLVQKVEREDFGSYCLRDGSEIFGPSKRVGPSTYYEDMTVSEAVKQYVQNNGVTLEQPNTYIVVFKTEYFILIGSHETV